MRFLIPLFFSIFSFVVLACPDNNSKDFSHAIQILTSERSNLCDAPAIGESHDILVNAKDSLTTVGQSYRLTRIAEKEFLVTFNLSFYPGGKNAPENEAIDKKLTQKWRKIASSCLKQTEGKIRGPNGEILNFGISEEADSKTTHGNVDISIRKNGRANSGSWTEEMEHHCETIFHELMHLTGLTDEYQEKQKGYVPDPLHHNLKRVEENATLAAYDCRPKYDEQTIMADEYKKWPEVMSPFQVRQITCACDNSDQCHKFEEEHKMGSSAKPYAEPTCPPGFSKTDVSEPIPASAVEYQKFKEGTLGMGMPARSGGPHPPWEKGSMLMLLAFEPKPPGSNDNLLEARHFNTIVYPGCLAKNYQYYVESQNSRRTSAEHGGKGCLNLDLLKAAVRLP